MPNVYFLYGNDEFAIARKLREFESDFPDPTSAGMNTARLDARTVSENDLNNAVNAMPFLAPSRLVILGNPSARYVKPPERKKFEEFLGHAPETVRLVMHEAVEPKEAEKNWLVKWAAKNGAKAQGYMLPRLKEMPGWIMNEVKNQGGALEPRAAAKLAEMTGIDTRQAGMEIAKLLAYVNWSRPVKLEDVEAVSIVTAEPDIFALVDAMANRDAGAAQRILHRLLENEDAFALWGMVIRQFRLLLQAREVIDAHGMVPDIQETLGVHPFVAEKIRSGKRISMPVFGYHHRLLVMMRGQDRPAHAGLALICLWQSWSSLHSRSSIPPHDRAHATPCGGLKRNAASSNTAARLCGGSLACRGSQPLQDGLPRLVQLRFHVIPLVDPELPADVRKIGLVSLDDVADDGIGLPASAARSLAELPARRRLSGSVEGAPACLQQLLEPLEVRPADRIAVRGGDHARRAEISRGIPDKPFHYLES
jgi:DNA polymerase-3 subunit delta